MSPCVCAAVCPCARVPVCPCGHVSVSGASMRQKLGLVCERLRPVAVHATICVRLKATVLETDGIGF
eukprot:5443981-Alexandrium_andersonii.AAC.1